MSPDPDLATPEYLEALRQIEAAHESYSVEQALAVAREQLRMDATYVTAIDSRQQTIEAIVGDVGGLGVRPGHVMPIEQTYCARMLSGGMPNVVPDTSREPAVRELAITRAIGSYIGVPVKLSDGRVHGSLCCVSHEARNDLGEQELRFMQVLAGIVATRVERARGELAGRTERLKSRPGHDPQ